MKTKIKQMVFLAYNLSTKDGIPRDSEELNEWFEQQYDVMFKPKKKPLEERKAIFTNKVLKHPDYGEIMLDEFIDYWTEHNDNGKVMKFEKQKTFNIKLRLKQWYKRSAQYQTKSNGVNQAWQ